MPTPMPTIAAVGGAQSGTSTTRLSTLSERQRDAEAEQRGDQRQAHGHRGAEGDQQDDGRGDEPDALGADRGGLGQRRDRAADLDLQGVVAGGEDRFDQRLGLRRGELVVPLVERDLGVRRRAVLGDLAGALVGERAGHAHDVVAVGDVGEELLGPGPHVGRGDAGVGVDARSGRCRRPAAGTAPRGCPTAACDSDPGCR